MSTPSSGPDLPFPHTPSASVAGRTLADSHHQWREDPERLPSDPPNIVIFMSDDAGFSAPECFGGPIHMPTMERLANRGLRFNRFHTTAICSPTRAALLTGRNHHAVGFGQISELASDFDGYVGEIPQSASTIAQVLSSHGYDTGAFGKWHNTPITHITPTGPFDLWPTGLGFRYFYGFLAGETSQYEPRLFENTNPVEPPATAAEGYHLTEDMAEKAISFIRNNRALNPDRPMFIYFAPGAVHGPHQVAREWADKYAGRFDDGWEALREETFRRQKATGWLPEDAELTPIDPTMQKWEDVPEEQQAFQIRLMEVFAGVLEHTDVQYGKVVDEFEAQGLLDNTLIFYIHSDNGASAEGMFGTIAELLTHNGIDYPVEEQIRVLESEYGGLEALGTDLVDSMYHHGWAWATDTPLRSTKLVAAHFGGTRTPMVVSWPKKVNPDPTPREQFHHVIDVAATIYEALGIEPPKSFNGFEQTPLDGDSMVPLFDDPQAETGKHTQYFEVMGSRGVYHDGWFAGAFGPRRPWVADMSGLIGWNPDEDVWELYRVADDYSQAKDLAEEMPEKLRELQDMFMVQAAKNKALPIGGGLYTAVYHPEEMRASTLTEWTLHEGQTRIAESLAPKFTSGFSTLATIGLESPEAASGVLFCVGGIGGGFTVYMDDGYLKAEYNLLAVERYKVSSVERVPAGEHQLEIELKYEERAAQAPATITLTVDGSTVGQGRVERSAQLGFTASETFDIGVDLGSPVALDYHDRAPFAFNGKIHRAHFKYI
jgi:arylsulfatase